MEPRVTAEAPGRAGARAASVGRLVREDAGDAIGVVLRFCSCGVEQVSARHVGQLYEQAMVAI